MPAKVLPDAQTLRHWSQGEQLTHAEIVERVFQQTGQRVTRQAVSAALNRIGAGHAPIRYDDLIPWTVKQQHNKHYHVRMLRLAAQEKRGVQLRSSDKKKMDSWRHRYIDGKPAAVVHYDPDTEEGFWLVKRRAGDLELIRPPTAS